MRRSSKNTALDLEYFMVDVWRYEQRLSSMPLKVDRYRFGGAAISGSYVFKHTLDLIEAHARPITEHRQFVAITTTKITQLRRVADDVDAFHTASLFIPLTQKSSA
jgi:hypothetical protein